MSSAAKEVVASPQAVCTPRGPAMIRLRRTFRLWVRDQRNAMRLIEGLERRCRSGASGPSRGRAQRLVCPLYGICKPRRPVTIGVQPYDGLREMFGATARVCADAVAAYKSMSPFRGQPQIAGNELPDWTAR